MLKLQGVVMGTIRTLIMKKIGYVQGLKIGTQDEKTKFWLFALCTVVPLVTSALGIIPKFLWSIDKKTREECIMSFPKEESSKLRTMSIPSIQRRLLLPMLPTQIRKDCYELSG